MRCQALKGLYLSKNKIGATGVDTLALALRARPSGGGGGERRSSMEGGLPVPRLHTLFLNDNDASDDNTAVLRAVLEQRTRTFTAPQVIFRATSRGVLTVPDREDPPAPAPAPAPLLPPGWLFGNRAAAAAAPAAATAAPTWEKGQAL